MSEPIRLFVGVGANNEDLEAQAVLEAAGGAVLQLSGIPLVYSKPEILNPEFVAVADPSVNWLRFFR